MLGWNSPCNFPSDRAFTVAIILAGYWQAKSRQLKKKGPGRPGSVKARRLAPRYLLSALAAGLSIFSSTLLAPAPAEAQTYYSIYGGYRNTPPQPYRDDRANPFVDFFGSLFGGRPRGAEEDEKKPNAFANHCVRTCDGKFFPVNRGGRKDLSLDKICSAMCPSAQTKIFSGLGIEQSVATDGQRYSAIPNAFAYRTKIVDNCTCNGRDPFGVANVDFDNDPTLQGGDLVVRPNGFSVFTGTPGNYTPIEKSGMSPAFVKQLIAIKILPDNPHATFAKTVPVMTAGPNTPAEPLPTTSQLQEPDSNANAPTANRPPARTN